jgi:hypothetical protein
MNFELNEEKIKDFLKKQKDSNLHDHYSFKESIKCNLNSSTEVVDFIKKNNPITINIKNGELYYNVDSKMEKDELFTINTDATFSASNQWLYDKIIPVELIYPNISEARTSSEMVSFYICLIVSSVLGDEFKDELLEIVSQYDFKNWKKTSFSTLNFDELSREWIQMGSETVKMISSSAKYSISRNSRKKELPSLLDLPEEMDLKYNSLRRSISDIRYEYDRILLSPINRENLTKLQIKVLISERDLAVQKEITSDNKLHQIWRLTNLNSNIIEPTVLRSYIRSSKKESVSYFEDLNGRVADFSNDNDLITLKKIQNKLKKEAIRATLNKIFKEEILKFKDNPNGYIAPSFV